MMPPPSKIPQSGVITKVADAIDQAVHWSKLDSWTWLSGWTVPSYTSPFGIWYRGQSISASPTPSVFRQQKENRYYDESSLFYHFQVRSPHYRDSHVSIFEWLCLMQHYGAPTRLLDWTESMLVALYFAVERDRGQNGELYVLNAALLNAHTDVPRTNRRAAVHHPESYNVTLRSVMAAHRESHLTFWSQELERHDQSDKPEPDPLTQLREIKSDTGVGKASSPDVVKFLEQLRKPVAVVPSRTNSRLITQQGMFTVHGGKAFPPSVTTSPRLRPFGFEDFPTTPFLRRYHIPAVCKEQIRSELNAAGIHQGALFPELDQQSEYMRNMWQR